MCMHKTRPLPSGGTLWGKTDILFWFRSHSTQYTTRILRRLLPGTCLAMTVLAPALVPTASSLNSHRSNSWNACCFLDVHPAETFSPQPRKLALGLAAAFRLLQGSLFSSDPAIFWVQHSLWSLRPFAFSPWGPEAPAVAPCGLPGTV